jgi:hypothetical protein
MCADRASLVYTARPRQAARVWSALPGCILEILRPQYALHVPQGVTPWQGRSSARIVSQGRTRRRKVPVGACCARRARFQGAAPALHASAAPRTRSLLLTGRLPAALARMAGILEGALAIASSVLPEARSTRQKGCAGRASQGLSVVCPGRPCVPRARLGGIHWMWPRRVWSAQLDPSRGGACPVASGASAGHSQLQTPPPPACSAESASMEQGWAHPPA